MSHFSNAINSALAELEWSQTHFSEASGIPRPQINRYVRGTSIAEPGSFERMLSVLPPHLHTPLLRAYLSDLVPSGYRHLVPFAEAPNASRKKNALPDGLDAELRETISTLAHLALEHTQIRDLLVSLVRTIQR